MLSNQGQKSHNLLFQVGGEISSTVLYKMNKFGRVVICGSISTYNDNPKKPTKGKSNTK